ncbi:MAG TPA: hypothetical protein VLC52_05555, partial [Anaerolineae bacterium]|nr:hypothetical protein [Anaerolineae bacterium]
MSKKLSTLMALLVIVTMLMAACGASPEPEPTQAEVQTEPTQAEVQPEPTTAPEATTAPEPTTAPEATTVTEPTTAPEPEPAGDAATRPLTIYAVQHAQCSFDAFWCTVEDGLNAAAEALGVELTILAPDRFDLERTAQLIEQAVAAQPDGLALTVTDADLFR